MKQLIIFILMMVVSFGANGQEQLISPSKKKNIKSISVHAYPGSKKVGIGAKFTSLYSLSKLINAGWGVGFEGYDSSIDRRFIPLTLEMSGDLFGDRPLIFYRVGIGYGIAMKEEASFASSAKGGLTYGFSIGLRNNKEAQQPYISAGYKTQRASYTGLDQYGDDNKSVIYNRWDISVGVIF